MPSAAAYRSKARGYLRQAETCGDELLADDLRALARNCRAEADRLEAPPVRSVPPPRS